MSLKSTSTGATAILLNPRPLVHASGGFLLLPLLPYRPQLKPLPLEVWTKILAYAYEYYESEPIRPCFNTLKLGLLLICKDLKVVALPLLYARVRISSFVCFDRFAEYLMMSDKKWDSICRIPYSTPGRWVQDLDLRELEVTLRAEAYRVDTLLSLVFPLLPFLSRLALSPTLALSRRALTSLSSRSEVVHLRVLKGLMLPTSAQVEEDAFVALLRACVNLEELSVVGSGLELADLDMPSESDIPLYIPPLNLPHLKKLVLLSMPSSPLMYSLLHSPLPSLNHLTITPYDDDFVPMSLVHQFLQAHGRTLTSLHLFTVKTWPAVFLPSPPAILQTCPNLHHLSLENPVPVLALSKTDPPHPLQILSIPRPFPEFLAILDALLPQLPSLKTVRARDVRWLRPGMSLRAQNAGVQGEMLEWRRRLARKGIEVVDSEWTMGVKY
ncbi:uncharacterized protein FIBRA_00090 [Fibroporia radiculosa]|uniref:F-box domain-containing protein n=1 Tax=Fibroporia radiculosa TaxID=599839 RepID=J7SBT0_9APHY|nr:uncharacterized protein FIBRA_00090 [Fibroporia radiculosa]CCL98096.1 predicted protein [Fibroporia radiculosa]